MGIQHLLMLSASKTCAMSCCLARKDLFMALRRSFSQDGHLPAHTYSKSIFRPQERCTAGRVVGATNAHRSPQHHPPVTNGLCRMSACSIKQSGPRISDRSARDVASTARPMHTLRQDMRLEDWYQISRSNGPPRPARTL